MAKVPNSRYVIEVWSKATPKGKKYYHHLACKVPHFNILSSGVHKSRSGRVAAVRRLKKDYPGAIVLQVSKPTKSK